MKPKRRRLVIGLLSVLCLTLVGWRACVLLLTSPLEIGRETTYVTGPVKPDGLIDYAAAFHELLSQGVHTDNNTAVLMAPLFGRGGLDPAFLDQYCQRLGVDSIPTAGLVVTESEFLLRKRGPETADDAGAALMEQFTRSRRQPWVAKDLPHVAEWLKQNEPAFDVIELAIGRPVCYSPPIGDRLDWESVSHISQLREVARLIVSRAMLRLGQGEFEAACRDLTACHRLAELFSAHAPGTNGLFVAIAIDSVASAGDEALVATTVPFDPLRTYLDQHQQLRDLATPASALDIGHRLLVLDEVIQQFGQAHLNYNVMLRKTNLFIDDLVAAEEHDRFTERAKAIDAIESEFKSRVPVAKSSMQQARDLLLSSRKTISASVGDQLLLQSIPAYRNVDQAWTRAQVRRDLTRIAIALSLYKADHGSFPDQLHALSPEYLPTVPSDRFTDLPLIYVTSNAGYLLYSRGANGKDDNGQFNASKQQDDLAISNSLRSEP